MGGGRHRPERIDVFNPEDVTMHFTVTRSGRSAHDDDVVDQASHAAGRHRDVVERRSVTHSGDDRFGSFMDGDVVGVPIESVFSEGHHNLGAHPLDRLADVGLEGDSVRPREHAVFVIQEDGVG